MDPRLVNVLGLLLEYKDKVRITNIRHERNRDVVIVYLQFENDNQAELASQLIEKIKRIFQF